MRDLSNDIVEKSHSDKGLLAVLTKPWVFNLFDYLIWKKKRVPELVYNYVRPYPGCRILDIGCGTASVLGYLPQTISAYDGFDMNPHYIDYARKHWRSRINCTFTCRSVNNDPLTGSNQYDIVLALRILHHLSDPEAKMLIKTAHRALKPEGVMITLDNTYIPEQSKIARWLISKDRGKAVRTTEGYAALAADYFDSIRSEIIHDAFVIPYTIVIMRWMKLVDKNSLILPLIDVTA